MIQVGDNVNHFICNRPPYGARLTDIVDIKVPIRLLRLKGLS